MMTDDDMILLIKMELIEKNIHRFQFTVTIDYPILAL